MTRASASLESLGPSRVRAAAVVVLMVSTVLGAVLIVISYGLAREYGDPTAARARIAGQALRDGGLGIVLVLGLSLGATLLARRSRARWALTTLAAVAVLGALLGVPGGAVLGVHHKVAGYPELPACTDGFHRGPGVPVVRAAEAGFAELDHPGPFSGGGSTGIDGCATQLVVGRDLDVPLAYRDTLEEQGWRIQHDQVDRIAAIRRGSSFEAWRDEAGSWWVWIGPAGLSAQSGQSGQVTPRR